MVGYHNSSELNVVLHLMTKWNEKKLHLTSVQLKILLLKCLMVTVVVCETKEEFVTLSFYKPLNIHQNKMKMCRN